MSHTCIIYANPPKQEGLSEGVLVCGEMGICSLRKYFGESNRAKPKIILVLCNGERKQGISSSKKWNKYKHEISPLTERNPTNGKRKFVCLPKFQLN